MMGGWTLQSGNARGDRRRRSCLQLKGSKGRKHELRAIWPPTTTATKEYDKKDAKGRETSDGYQISAVVFERKKEAPFSGFSGPISLLFSLS
jgi:hypothetical protein